MHRLDRFCVFFQLSAVGNLHVVSCPGMDMLCFSVDTGKYKGKNQRGFQNHNPIRYSRINRFSLYDIYYGQQEHQLKQSGRDFRFRLLRSIIEKYGCVYGAFSINSIRCMDLTEEIGFFQGILFSAHRYRSMPDFNNIDTLAI